MEALLLQLIFPEEVWLAIFESVKEPSYWSIRRSSQYFQALLKHSRVYTLFPKVLKVFIVHFQNHDLQEEDKELHKGWNRNELLVLRRVCYNWKNGVDKLWCEGHKMLLGSEVPGRKHPLSGILEIFKSSEDFKRFRRNFNETHLYHETYPLMCRSVTFVFPSGLKLLPDYYRVIFEFLKQCGGRIRYCHVISNIDLLEAKIEFYTSKLQQVITLMPKLKTVQFSAWEFVDDKKKTLTVLEHSENLCPFPNLPKLKQIKISGLPLPVLQKLVQSNPQIHTVDNERSNNGHHLKFCLEQMSSLANVGMHMECRKELQLIGKITIIGRVKKLHCDMHSLPVPWNSVFWTLETLFSQTLTELTICLPVTEVTGAILSLPNLQVLNLRVYKAIPLDFMLPLKEKLLEFSLAPVKRRLFNGFRVDKCYQGVINLYQFWNKPEESNLWILFPKLRHLKIWKKADFTFKWYFYTRRYKLQ